MKRIKLTKGQYALVDDGDFESINKFKWCARKSINTFYAVRGTRAGGKRVSYNMHRVIMGVIDPQILIDHKDGNGLNNCRVNLRLSDKSQNAANRRPHKDATSKYMGVSWDASKSKWACQLMVKGIMHHLGRFNSEIEAAVAYNKKALELHGEFARLNKITDTTESAAILNKKIISVKIHKPGILNDSILRMIANHNAGKKDVTPELIRMRCHCYAAEWGTDETEFGVLIDFDYVEIVENCAKTLTISWEEPTYTEHEHTFRNFWKDLPEKV